jgi:hypothetical protein
VKTTELGGPRGTMLGKTVADYNRFMIQPKRQIVKQRFGCLNRLSRLSKASMRTVESSEAFI